MIVGGDQHILRLLNSKRNKTHMEMINNSSTKFRNNVRFWINSPYIGRIDEFPFRRRILEEGRPYIRDKL